MEEMRGERKLRRNGKGGGRGRGKEGRVRGGWGERKAKQSREGMRGEDGRRGEARRGKLRWRT